MKLTVMFTCDDYNFGAPRNDLADALERLGREMRLWTAEDTYTFKLIHRKYDTFELIAKFEDE